MEKIKINTKRPWGAVPESLLTDKRLGHAACRLGCWLATRPNDWVVHRSHAMGELSLGIDAWQSARRQLVAAGYLKIAGQAREKGVFRHLLLEFDPQPDIPDKQKQFASTVGGKTAHGSTARGSTVHGFATHLTTIEVKQKQLKQKQQPQQGGCEFQVVQEVSANSQSQSLKLSEVLGLAGEQARQLDLLAQGATIVQLELLKAAHAGALEAGTIKNEGAWLSMMARKAAGGGITGFKTQGGAGVAANVIDELKAHAVPVGTVISVGDKQLTVDHIDGVPRVLDGGLWIGAPRSLKVLQRVQTGELSTMMGSAA